MKAERQALYDARVPPEVGREYGFKLPLPPNFVNPRSQADWRAKHWAKSKYETVCQVSLLSTNGLRFCKARYRAHIVTPGARDPDNLFAILKWPIDALRKSEIIWDDTAVYFSPDAIPTNQVVSTPRMRKHESAGEFVNRKLKAERQWGVQLSIWEVG